MCPLRHAAGSGQHENSLHDELIADYAGLVAAAGQFRAEWFLRFMGLENYPAYREGGRLQNYRGTPPMDNREFLHMQQLAYIAAHAVEVFDEHIAAEHVDHLSRARVLLTLAGQSVEVLAGPNAHHALMQAWSESMT
jgi:hypothetical protein